MTAEAEEVGPGESELDDSTVAFVPTGRRDPAPPIDETTLVPRDRDARLFKPPLDSRRRARESPFPQSEHTLPKRGVRPGMPVVYGARSDSFAVFGQGPLDLERRIGAAPAATAARPARRDGLPSMARFNRKFRVLVIAGGAGVLAVVGFGLWGIAAIAFG